MYICMYTYICASTDVVMYIGGCVYVRARENRQRENDSERKLKDVFDLNFFPDRVLPLTT